MQKQIQELLNPIRRRLTRQQGLPRVAAALMAGGWLALVAALMTLFGGSFTSGLIGIAVAIGFPIAAWGWTLLAPAGWEETARLIDRRLRLHNRTTTALQVGDERSDPFAALQVEDTLAALQQANLKGIHLSAPWERLAGGLVLTLFAVGLILWGIIAPPTAAIQTSGDMQDIRPEIVERSFAEPTGINTQTLANSVEFASGQTEVESQGTSPIAIGDDVAGRYFDLLAD